jgi:hypothetical protein
MLNGERSEEEMIEQDHEVLRRLGLNEGIVFAGTTFLRGFSLQ